ncbi:putative dipeptidase [Hyphomicrobium sulfonivorans]|uniref:Putative dipeptidase n=1 Tax=Hyphomicrobium sulfonivorans TaxID=121290 RepID=A0A120CUI1_HYPSL|nr:membrane dipeptidase [Hyphomicrobium sulfonivorans]KWT66270.1 putative dipeptidase [Hyphomicrobium sulfonivorans]
MQIDRRQFALGALAASCTLTGTARPSFAEGRAPVYIGDMHAHLFFFGANTPDKKPLGPTMRAGHATLVGWSLVGDVPWIRPTSKGLKQKGSPKPGEAAEWFETDIVRIKKHIADQNLKLALTPNDVDNALAGDPHVVLTLEGATIVEDDATPLVRAWEQGVRSVQLVHYIENPIGDFQTERPRHGGLTPLGFKVIEECNRLGILIDLAHCTDKATRQAIEASSQPVIWSHSSVTRTRQPNWKMPVWQARQITFDTAKLMAEKGGVVGLWPMRSDIGAGPDAYAKRLWELGQWLGAEHAGIGTDMNAISRPAIASYSDLQKVVRAWQKAGHDDTAIRNIAIGNFARVLKQAMAARQA